MTYKKRIRLWGKRPCAGVDTRWGKLSCHDWRDWGGRQTPHIAGCLVPTKLPTCRSRTRQRKETQATANSTAAKTKLCFTSQTCKSYTHKINQPV